MNKEKFLVTENTTQFICTGHFHSGQLRERKQLAATAARSQGSPLPCIVTLEGMRAVKIEPAPTSLDGLSLV